jgi:hypothetical protein
MYKFLNFVLDFFAVFGAIDNVGQAGRSQELCLCVIRTETYSYTCIYRYIFMGVTNVRRSLGSCN